MYKLNYFKQLKPLRLNYSFWTFSLLLSSPVSQAMIIYTCHSLTPANSRKIKLQENNKPSNLLCFVFVMLLCFPVSGKSICVLSQFY